MLGALGGMVGGGYWFNLVVGASGENNVTVVVSSGNGEDSED